MEEIKLFFVNNFSNMMWLAVFIMALLPITEGRIAFPFAINESLLKQEVMNPFLAILTCFLASIFLCLFLLTFFKGIYTLMNRVRFFNSLINNINNSIIKKSKKIDKYSLKYFYLGLFVFIPLPLTGVWSASLIASFLNLDFIKSLISIVLGNLFCLIMIYILSLLFKDFTLPLIAIAFLICLSFFIIKKIHLKISKKSKKA